MGEVFLAHDRTLDNDVAIKRLSPQFAASPELRQSLQREAQIMARLSDASIVRLFDLAEFYGDHYLILEYVAGPTLREMIRSGYRASPQELAKVIGEICQGLTVAHNAGVIHRDLKPSNLLLALHGQELAAFLNSRQLPANLASAKVKITDFGIAKAIAEGHLTVTNAFSGTPGYMAPEQFRGEVPWPQTDVYALGVITHELLTGALPTLPLRTIPGVHPAVTEVVRKALSPAMQSRFASAGQFYEALYNAIEGRSPVARVPVPARSAALPIALALGGVVLVVLLIVAAALATHDVSGRGPTATVPKFTTPATSTPYISPIPQRPPPFDWPPFPRASEPPPVVDEARGRLVVDRLLGPQNPKVKWDVTLPDMSSPRIAIVGKDGTVYVAGSSGEFCAIRDGKLQWAYKSTEFAASIQELDMDQDGRVWFKIHTMGGYERFAFNRDGKGGRLPASYEDRGPTPKSSSRDYSCWKNKHTLTGPEGDLDLEDDCLAVEVGPDARIYVATNAPQILAVSKQGHVEFKYKPPCQPGRLIPVLPNQLVFTCPDGSLHSLRGTSEVWNLKTDGEISYAKTDANGTLYFGDGKKDAKTGHAHAVDTTGKNLWTTEVRYADGEPAFGSDRQMYVLQNVHDFFQLNHLISLSD
jgi:serine/threonine protein kinase